MANKQWQACADCKASVSEIASIAQIPEVADANLASWALADALKARLVEEDGGDAGISPLLNRPIIEKWYHCPQCQLSWTIKEMKGFPPTFEPSPFHP